MVSKAALHPPVVPGNILDKCPACGSSAAPLWGHDDIVRCLNCTLAYRRRIPSLPELQQMYSEEFFKGTSSYADYVAEKASLQRNFQPRIRTLHALRPSGKLYEVGCAYGFFLELARDYWEVQGSDISEEAVTYARDELGLKVSVGDFENLQQEPNNYDIIAMWDTIEHLYDPIRAIELSYAALRPGGILAMTTGDLGALAARLQKNRWRLIHPCHLYYFSGQSMRWILENTGFEVVNFTHPGNYRSLTQMAIVLTYGKSGYTWRHRLFHHIEKMRVLDRIRINVNLFDIMFVAARKPDTP